MNEFKFKDIININKCARRSLLQKSGVQGNPQFYCVKNKYIRDKVNQYIANKFSAEHSGTYEEYLLMYRSSLENVDYRLNQLDLSEMLRNLEKLIAANDIIIGEINKSVTYTLSTGSIIINVDAIGTFGDNPALFKITTSRFKKKYALELIAALYAFSQKLENQGRRLQSSGYKLIILKLGDASFKEIPRLGERNKNGSMKKNGLRPWRSLRSQVENIMKEGTLSLTDLQNNPDRYNKPRFGSCATCEYHNFKVELNGERITCGG